MNLVFFIFHVCEYNSDGRMKEKLYWIESRTVSNVTYKFVGQMQPYKTQRVKGKRGKSWKISDFLNDAAKNITKRFENVSSNIFLYLGLKIKTVVLSICLLKWTLKQSELYFYCTTTTNQKCLTEHNYWKKRRKSEG